MKMKIVSPSMCEVRLNAEGFIPKVPCKGILEMFEQKKNSNNSVTSQSFWKSDDMTFIV